MEFVNINLNFHKDIVIRFRKDSFKESFRHSKDFNEEENVLWLEEKVQEFPDGFLLLKKENEYIGQVELTIKRYKNRVIGYINLYYLTKPYRGKGYAEEMHTYALRYFENNGLEEYHLRVSPTNRRAIKFYQKNGLEKINEEHVGKVMRMRGYL